MPASRLNPVLEIDGEAHVLVTQYLAAVPVKVLKTEEFSVARRRDEIVAAIDLLLQGF